MTSQQKNVWMHFTANSFWKLLEIKLSICNTSEVGRKWSQSAISERFLYNAPWFMGISYAWLLCSLFIWGCTFKLDLYRIFQFFLADTASDENIFLGFQFLKLRWVPKSPLKVKYLGNRFKCMAALANTDQLIPWLSRKTWRSVK